APLVGLPMPAISFRMLLLPEPFRPMIPNVRPAVTVKLTSLSASSTSSGCRSRKRRPVSSALFSVPNCPRRPYRRYSFDTPLTSMAFIGSGGLCERVAQPIEDEIAAAQRHQRQRTNQEQTA